ncbi:endoribonuclease rege-1-like [Rhopilema esculentum]|uniref:endoribonuclease rege-1-like n=1 Tax=Rhopilema esculentum TaxID=499914 RepID=UPI0031D0F88F|eukprot:gene8323-14288_t
MENESVSEFVISFQRSSEIRRLAPQINTLFGVRFEFSSVNARTAQRVGNEWIKVYGTKEARDKAKEFVKGIDNPEKTAIFAIPNDIVNSGSWQQEYIWSVQQKFGVVIRPLSATELLLQGSELVIQQSLSFLDEFVRIIRQSTRQAATFGPTYYGTPNTQYYQGYYHAVQGETVDRNVPYVQQDIVCRGAPQVPRSSLQTLNETYQAAIDNTIVPKGAVPKSMLVNDPAKVQNQQNQWQTVGSQLRDYASKLDYTDEEIHTALAKCHSIGTGQTIDENALLQQLIALYPCKKPAFRSQTVNKDNSFKSQQVPPLLNETKTEPSPSAKRTVKKDGCSVSSFSSNLRPIVVDGSNVAMSHGNRDVFSCKGIKLCVDYFKKRGHDDITVFVPQWRKEASKPDRPIVDQQILLELEKDQILSFTPSRRVNGQRVVCYDDRYIVKLAAENDGVIVSNDNFRDLTKESPEWKKVIDERLLMYTFVKDVFMPPDDPLGRHGPSLDKFLCKGTFSNPRPCPYMKKCTYGSKCKYYHPEKTPSDNVNKEKESVKRTVQDSAVNQNGNLSSSKQQLDQLPNTENTMPLSEQKNTTQIEHKNVSVENETKSTDLSSKKEQDQIEKDTTLPDYSPSRVNELQALLEDVLPDQKEKIKQVLKDNPKETNLDTLINLILPN